MSSSLPDHKNAYYPKKVFSQESLLAKHALSMLGTRGQVKARSSAMSKAYKCIFAKLCKFVKRLSLGWTQEETCVIKYQGHNYIIRFRLGRGFYQCTILVIGSQLRH